MLDLDLLRNDENRREKKNTKNVNQKWNIKKEIHTKWKAWRFFYSKVLSRLLYNPFIEQVSLLSIWNSVMHFTFNENDISENCFVCVLNISRWSSTYRIVVANEFYRLNDHSKTKTKKKLILRETLCFALGNYFNWMENRRISNLICYH